MIFPSFLYFSPKKYTLRLRCFEVIVTSNYTSKIFEVATPLLFRSIIQEHFTRYEFTYLCEECTTTLRKFVRLCTLLKAYCVFTLDPGYTSNVYPEIESMNVGREGYVSPVIYRDTLSKIHRLQKLEFMEQQNIHEFLVPIPTLETLMLNNCVCTDEDLKKIGEVLPHIKKLVICDDQSDISDDGVKYITNLKNLRRLSLNSAPHITDASIKYLSESPNTTNLCKLELECSSITDEGAKIISESKNFKNLKFLDLSDTLCTEDAGDYLKDIELVFF